MHVVLFECPELRLSLLPLTYTRAVSDFRIGVLTISEKWEKRTKIVPSVVCAEDYLQSSYDCTWKEEAYFVHAHLCPDNTLYEAVRSLRIGEALYYRDILLATRVALSLSAVERRPFAKLLAATATTRREFRFPLRLLDTLWRPLDWNAEEIVADIALLGVQASQSDQLQSIGLRCYGKHSVFAHKSVHANELICNTEQGPIYIGEQVRIEEGASIQGPAAICKGTQINMGAKLRAGTSIGPGCKVGGEISRSILFSYSNKAHEGFLGDSVLGAWCNIGAGTSCSNLKNTYGEVSLWDYRQQAYVKTGKQFCGMFMGDYAKSAILQSFNTGTVVGPFSNVFGRGFPPRQLPAFTWGGVEERTTYRFEEAVFAAVRMMARRDVSLSEIDRRVFAHIFEKTKALRT